MKTRNRRSFVVGISSISGGGKTAVAKKLAELVQDAVTLCFDDYDNTTMHPENLRTWLMEGADYNVWKTPVLTNHLLSLTTGNPIISPVDGSRIRPAKYIVFDAPLGRAHSDTGRFIDFMVFINTPLDIAMASKLLRNISSDNEQSAEDTIQSLIANLSSYLNGARLLYLEMDRLIKPKCDLILDGCLTVEELATAIYTRVTELPPNKSLHRTPLMRHR
jgi:uridine kinase